MSNILQIQPKSILTANGSKDATLFSLVNFFDYHFDNGHGKVTFKLLGMESPGTTTDSDGNTVNLPETAVEYLVDNMEIPASIIQQWGTDDSIIFTYVMNKLSIIPA